MQALEADETPAEEWLSKLNASCNRLSTQYLNLLQSGTKRGQQSGRMEQPNDPPPPALASDVALQTLQCQLASENICAAASDILSLIRTLRLSLLLMDDDTIKAEQQVEWDQQTDQTKRALQEAVEMEQKLMELKQRALEEGSS